MMRTSLFNDLIGLRNSIDQLFGESGVGNTYGASSARRGTDVAHLMPLDVYVTDEQVVIMGAVPGMHPDDLELTVLENTITLGGTLRSVTDTEEARNATWYVHELPSGTYRRSVTLPFAVDADRANATFEHGILRVVLPKAEASRPKRISISAGQQEAIGAGSTSQS